MRMLSTLPDMPNPRGPKNSLRASGATCPAAEYRTNEDFDHAAASKETDSAGEIYLAWALLQKKRGSRIWTATTYFSVVSCGVFMAKRKLAKNFCGRPVLLIQIPGLLPGPC